MAMTDAERAAISRMVADQLRQSDQRASAEIDALRQRVAALEAARAQTASASKELDIYLPNRMPKEQAAAVVESVRDFVERSCMPLHRRIKHIEGYAMRYRGIWKGEEVYVVNDVSTHGGGQWICRATAGTNTKPGTSGDWQLMSKPGK
jgi:hypothetical protein